MAYGGISQEKKFQITGRTSHRETGVQNQNIAHFEAKKKVTQLILLKDAMRKISFFVTIHK